MHKFGEFVIGVERFQGYVADGGLFLIHQCSQGRTSEDIALGNVTSIEAVVSGQSGQSEWQVMKYKTQPHIRLHCLSLRQVQELSRTFGIPKGGEMYSHDVFVASPAFETLRRWAKECQRSGPYLRSWYDEVCVSSSTTSK